MPVQIYRCSGELGTSGAGAPRPAEESSAGKRRGNLPRDLSYRCCHGGNTLQVCTRTQRQTPPFPSVAPINFGCACLRVLLEQVEHWEEFLALVNMILFCTAVPGYYPVNETTSSLTLTFWYSLQVRMTLELNTREIWLGFTDPIFCLLDFGTFRMTSCHLRRRSRQRTCRSTGQFTSSWWTCFCINLTTLLRRITPHGLRMTRSSSEYTGEDRNTEEELQLMQTSGVLW